MNSTQSNAIAHVETTGIEVLSNVFYITNSLLDESLPSTTSQESHDALESMDWFQKGLFAYNQAIELNEKHTKSYNCLGAICETKNQLNKATHFYRQAAYWGDVSAKQWGLEHGYHWI